MNQVDLNIEINGHTISYREKDGITATLLFIHGNSSSKNSFKYQFCDPIFQSYRLIALDLPGHGSSSWRGDKNDYSIPAFAALITDFIDKHGLQNVVLVGHSLGGHVAIEAALNPAVVALYTWGTPPMQSLNDFGLAFCPHPSSVINLPPNVTLAEAIISSNLMASYATSEDREELAQNIIDTDPTFRPSFFQNVLQSKFENEYEIVKNISIPTVIANGSDDPLVSTSYIKNLPIFSQHIQFQVFEKTCHYPQIEKPKLFNHILEKFVSSI